MPRCLACRKFSNCLTIDPCDHCGAKNWDENTVLRAVLQPEPLPKSEWLPPNFKNGSHSLGWVGNLVGYLIGGSFVTVFGVFGIAVFLGGLWLLVFIVKWMWQHS